MAVMDTASTADLERSGTAGAGAETAAAPAPRRDAADKNPAGRHAHRAGRALDAGAAVAAYWAACAARDWTGFGELLAAEVVYDLPQSRERIHGRDRFVRFNAEYPGDWELTVERIIGATGTAASWVRLRAGDKDLPAASFFDFDEAGLIVRITEFWPEPYDPPAGREHLAERY